MSLNPTGTICVNNGCQEDHYHALESNLIAVDRGWHELTEEQKEEINARHADKCDNNCPKD